jgi:hypothetical protein
MNDPAIKDASLSERQSRLQQALAPYGQRGERLLEKRLQIEQQAQQENLIKKAKTLSKDPNITPSEIALSLYEIAGPQGAKMVPQLTQMIMDQRTAANLKTLPAPGQGTQPAAPQAGLTTPVQKGAEGAPVSPTDFNARRANLPLAIPEPSEDTTQGALEETSLGQGPIPKTYTEDDYRNVYQQYASRGMDPSPAINLMKESDAAARAKINDLTNAAKDQAAIAGLRAERQAAYRGILSNELPGRDERVLGIAERISQKPEYKKISNDKIRASAVAKEVKAYENAEKSFKEVSERPNYDPTMYEHSKQNLATKAKIMVDAGEYSQADKILADNGWGPVERSEILNPIPKEVETNYKKLPPLKSIEEMQTKLPDMPGYEQEFEKVQKTRANNLNNYESFIESSLKPGTLLKPGTSLLQLRDMLMQKGMSWQEFDGIVNNLIKDGRITLDGYQYGVELPMLSQHPDKSFGIGELLWRSMPIYKGRR